MRRVALLRRLVVAQSSLASVPLVSVRYWLSLSVEASYCDEKVANGDIRIWHLVIENGY